MAKTRNRSGDEPAPAPAGRGQKTEVGHERFAKVEPPPSIGRFEVLEKIGEGGMGSVFAAHDPQTGSRIAIKVVAADLATAQARLRREAKVMAELDHANVVKVFEVGEFEGGLYLAMELIEGTTLRDWLEEEHPWREVLALFLRAANGLIAAHQLGIVHRDFKPENVLLDREGCPKLVDFGLAKPLAGTEAQQLSQMAAKLTRTGVTVGTPDYVAPEQLAGKPVDTRADQFAFCASLFEGLYAQAPFSGTTIHAMWVAMMSGELNPAPSYTDVPRAIYATLARGLLPDPARRFRWMGELVAALEAGSGGGPGPSGKKGWLGRLLGG